MMRHEIQLFCLGIGAGVFLSAFFDAGRALRKKVPHSNAAVAVEDFIFWLVTAGMLFFLFEKYNKGVLRFYVFLGIGIGILVYVLVLTRLFFPCFLGIVKVMAAVFRLFYIILGKSKIIVKKILILPLKKIWERIKIIHNNI